jgi:tetrahydromethanopterin S-methyltransferase subunit B
MLRLIRSFTPAVRVYLIVSLVLLALASAPHSALAALVLTVDNDGDASGQACTTGPTDCSLRSAIEIANTSSGVTIVFDNSYTIVLGGPLPPITAADTAIDGGAFTIKIDANNAGRVFTISGNHVRIMGLRMYGTIAALSQVFITGNAVHVEIANNVIGSDSVDGPCNLSLNTFGGIYVGSTGGTLAGGARVWIYGNTIECNLGSPGEGITLAGTDNVVIGADAASNAGPAQANVIRKNFTGIKMTGGANLNFVRNSLITKIGGVGVWLNSSSFNVVKESTITTQTSSGVWIDGGSNGNRIGSPAGGPTTSGNVISGNGADGVYFSDAGTYGNLVYGNRIGTDAAGSSALPNSRNGVMIDNGAHDNQIGATPTERNIISGNTSDGVQILNGAHDNLVQGNIIGANISGTLALPNLSGIAIYQGAQNNLIGGPISVTGNVILGNTAYGIYIGGSGTVSNTLTNNVMGYKPEAGFAVPNGWDNIILTDFTHANVIGGLDAPNAVYVAGGSGIYVAAAAYENIILKNYIVGNGMYGVLFDGTYHNVISRTVILNNGVTCPGCDGIAERNSAGPNLWTEVAIQGNAGLGIDKLVFSDNTNIVNAPDLVFTGVNRSTGVVMGIAPGTGPGGITKVELYRVAFDPSGYGEGNPFIASVYTDPNGIWSITDPYIAVNAPCYTATTTVTFLGQPNSSEFSRSSCSLLLPLIRR